MSFISLFNPKFFNLKVAIAIALVLLVLYVCYIEIKLNQAEIDLSKRNQEISSLEKDLDNTKMLLQVKTELAESYKRITEEQTLRLKETEESFKTYRESVDNSLNNNPSWANSQLPSDLKNTLNIPPLIKPIEKGKQ